MRKKNELVVGKMNSKKDLDFSNEIALMMFGFGDSKTPNRDTVILIESILLKQLREMVHEASINAERRNVKIIKPEDIIFQLRHDRQKMQRLMKYFHHKSLCIHFGNTGGHGSKKWAGGGEMLKKFIRLIDETGELLDTSEFDSVKYERALRAERISTTLDEARYREYAKARQASFLSKNISQPKRFQNWIDPNLMLSLQTVELLELFAYGIVGHIVDMVFIIRQNKKRAFSDPLKMLSNHYLNGDMFNAPHQLNNNNSNNNNNLVETQQFPITVGEVEEVLRRCYMPQVGYIKFTNKSILGKRKLFLY